MVGTRYLAPETVVASLGLSDRASVFEDPDQLERRVLKMGGVEAVRVARRLPGTLVVRVSEAEPVALVAGREGLVPVDAEGRRLPFDPAAAPVDVPVVPRIEPGVLQVLAALQSADPGLFGEVAAARRRGDAVVLELSEGWVLMAPPVSAELARSVSAVRRDLAARRLEWRGLDARFRGWVVVRRAAARRGAG